MYISKLFLEQLDYNIIHGHERSEVGSIEWFFHNYEHGYKHCKGGKANPYEIVHRDIDNKHSINKEFARGHGIKKVPTWFKFKYKLDNEYWDLASGVEVDTNEVPENMKFNINRGL